MDLVRDILIAVSESNEGLFANAFVDGKRTEDEVLYHFQIMDEAGLINATVTYSNNDRYTGFAKDLTWAGSDFLDAVRSDTIWQKAKMKVAKTTSSASFEVVKALAVKLATEALM